MHVTLTDVQVTEYLFCDVDVEFELIHPGHRGSWVEEPVGPEFEITGYSVLEAWGENWNKSREQLDEAGWLDLVEDTVDSLLDSYCELYELQNDVYNYGE